MADTRPLGVFDSGVGGLTVVRELNRLLPTESIIYLGDTARVPYGNKSPEAVQRYALEDSQFLMTRGVKAIIVACNTATAYGLELLQQSISVPVIGVILPGAEAAIAQTRSGKIGIIATTGTIASKAYQDLIVGMSPDVEIVTAATPLFVPLIEENWLNHPASKVVAEEYLRPLLDAKIDTLVLACTHYPMICPLLTEICGSGVALVDSASTCARFAKELLIEKGIQTDATEAGTVTPCLTDVSEHFSKLAAMFLDRSPGKIERVSVDLQ